MIPVRSDVYQNWTQPAVLGEKSMYDLIIAVAFIGLFAAPAIFVVRADTKANRK
jgi:hypothetical protein